ncbi:hypothetical protein AX016_0667 [Cellulophaga sp. RHA19]|uniref:hypothetical protein n=1 Tax=Cellulophaga sp. RHA19 TaxID=1798237 RepID=UPI000C2B6A93|nr:hypothetical protein [Cellulophaga sp. RHA19]PKB42500.1 hypothetical protein AX016_0667 [Cellulophaga sp. RHA19]
MKNFVPIVILLFTGAISCSNELELNGNWINTYYSDENRQIQNIDLESRILLNIKNNKIRIKEFPNHQDQFEQLDTILDFQPKKQKLIFKDQIGKISGQFIFAKDSIIFNSLNSSKSYSVFKKIPDQPKKATWNPINKSYRYSGNKSIMYADFVNDTLMIHYNGNNEKVSKNEWSIEDIGNLNFLLLNNNLYKIQIKIDSVINEKIYLTSYDNRTQKYVFEEQTKINLENLLGKWQIKNKNDLKKPTPIIDPYWRNYIENLTVFKDSIKISSTGQNLTGKWELSGSGGLIFFYGKSFRTFRILSLTEQEMELETGSENWDGKMRLIYRRK